jgi:murein DD-endopeptidase MepM/ murein hydrolase activator NlpD
MPHRSASHSPQSHGRPRHSPDARAHHAAAIAVRAPHGADYTLVHAGRQLRIGPIAFWIVVGTLVIMGIWTITTATYFAFRDDVLTRLIARQSEMQFGYEDRIAELRSQVDRISSRQLLDQEQYEQKLEQILRRQAALEQRGTALNNLPDSTVTGSVRPAGRTGATTEPVRGGPHKPSQINDTGILTVPLDRDARLPLSKTPGGFDAALARLQASLDRVEARQTTTMHSLEESYEAKARRIRGVLAELGIEAANNGPPVAAVGGPLVPLRPQNEAVAFERRLQRIQLARAQFERLSKTLVTVPVRRPMDDLDTSSGFGVRTDPFTRGPAMHTGLDFRGEPGDPVRATANGTVTLAGPSGGYGRLVELDHGNGLSTRYGHLSVIAVQVGQAVKIGQIIGKVGSTGRSTGPHLHYETRVDGDAVDPQKFLRAGAKLAGVN